MAGEVKIAQRQLALNACHHRAFGWAGASSEIHLGASLTEAVTQSE